MDCTTDKSPLTDSEGNQNNSHIPSITVVRPKQPRRYKLLPKDKLRFPKSDTSNQFWRKYDYTKHMPLITVDCDDEESEEFDGALFQKVSNNGLHDVLKRDRTNRNGLSAAAGNPGDEWDDDWNLNLSTPSQRRRLFCCPLDCTLS
uniref:Uncharacterized protein n=1 Tax=Trichobilharzia regenti TaxID=157069 RepID=A0AA85JMJ1_TRIRE|nr:unnamed protein product [Trichobilharzia regenti]